MSESIMKTNKLPNTTDPALQPFARPSGQFSGDTFPIFHNGVWHLFHMQMPAIGHHVSRDLVHWEARPMAVARGATGAPDCDNNATGCIIEHAQRFYLFYTGNQNVCLAMSDDLDHWTKHPRNPLVQGDDKFYERANFRDPFVFYHPPEKLWWMLVGTRTLDQPGQRAGCVGLAKSRDLLHWQLGPPLWSPRTGPHMDCPQLLPAAGRWWLLHLQRNTRYRVCAKPTGPFHRSISRNLGTSLMAAGSRPGFDGKRWIAFPFVGRQKDASEAGDFEYGGPLAIPRQLRFSPRGVVTERPADEVLAALHALPNPGNPFVNSTPITGQWKTSSTGAMSQSPAGGLLLLPTLPADFYLEFDLTLRQRDSDFHLLLRATPDLLHGYQLALHPRTRQVSLRPISQWDLDRVLVSRSLAIPVGKPLKVRMFLAGSILEVFLGDRASLTARLYTRPEGLTGFEFRDGTGAVRNVQWRPLINQDSTE